MMPPMNRRKRLVILGLILLGAGVVLGVAALVFPPAAVGDG